MISPNTNILPPKKQAKAVGLLSGGLDSTLAAQVVRDLGVEIHAVYFAMPWGCCDKTKAQEAAEKLGIRFIVMQLDERYLEIVKNPKHGYGSALNPCVDCRIHMFSRAAQYMQAINADFIFTGEVLGQRPMSQLLHSMKRIEEGTGLQGRLLRPLCAQLLDPTIPEKEGLIDREKLLKINGRSRRDQIELARRYEISDYLPPAGGCLLTDQNFANRMRDVFQHGYRTFRETVALKWGRHFRISPEYKIVLGRDEEENESLKRYAHPDDIIMELPDKRGPTLILKGPRPSGDILALAAGFIQAFSKHKNSPPVDVEYWLSPKPDTKNLIKARSVTEPMLEEMKI
ncbi:MAG: hypothetical protein Q8Q08_08985 [Candidatus Omnitrophota bacterium]|nr:hypothetical protein [Candidatus Omnitrophota bacterium]MDZ4242626.1 hypothetical protein [Candidatus Omnitrophota bacterium]